MTNLCPIDAAPLSNHDSLTEHERAQYELAVDHIQVMLNQEARSYMPCVDYTSDECDIKSINTVWRRRICEWGFGVADHFGYSREIVSLMMNYLDRYMCYFVEKDVPLCKGRFQLSSVACLLIAAKITGSFQADQGRIIRLRASTLVDLGRGLFSVEAIEKMEKEVFFVLNWKINPPTAIRFVSHYMHLFPQYGRNGVVPKRVISAIFEKARYLTELSICVSTLAIKCKQSVVAYASLLNAMDCMSRGSLPQDVRDSFLRKLTRVTGISSYMDEVDETREILKDLCPNLSDIAPIEPYEEDPRLSPLCVSEASPSRKRRLPS